LKHDYGSFLNAMKTSLPMRERGLKLKAGFDSKTILEVAPHAGAWIETRISGVLLLHYVVAPHAGVWIETNKILGMRT